MEAMKHSKEDVTRSVISGAFDLLPPANSRVIRIFLSSTFSDMASERNVLMKKVYPRLKDYCREHYGVEFQVIDMRWGVRSESQLDHKGPSLCIQEVRNCQSLSMGPSFILLLGQRYGGHPPPSEISSEHFQVLLKSLESRGEATDMLRDCYREDRNANPPVLILRPIVDDAESATKEEIEAAKKKWQVCEKTISKLLKIGFDSCVADGSLSPDIVRQYSCSVTESEIQVGLVRAPASKRRSSAAFVRRICDLKDFISHPKLSRFTDINSGSDGPRMDTQLQQVMEGLLTEVASQIPTDQLCHYSVPWRDGISDNSHADYLQEFAEDFFLKTRKLIDDSLSKEAFSANSEVYTEVLHHLRLCTFRNKHFQGRAEVVGRVREYVLSDEQEPLVVFGASGSGKTSVLAKAARLCRSWLSADESKEAIVVLRFLGTSPASTSLNQTLRSLCRQLAMFGDDEDRRRSESVEEFRAILDLFNTLLECVGRQRRVLLFLDSLDQLDGSSGAYYLTWLRTELPRGVKMVVSTLPDMYGLLDTLRLRIRAENFLEVPPLHTAVCADVLQSLLDDAGRGLTELQWRTVNAAFQKCSLPIFVFLVFQQVLSWPSYRISGLFIADSVRGAICQLFESLEKKHGSILTRHAFAYITASRNGLSETEIEDLLSLDDVVLRDVFQFHLPPSIRIPPLCWSRLRHDIGNYLVERSAGGTRVVFWYHRQFIEVAREYFLGDPEERVEIHSNLADYFLGVWGGGRRKPFRYPEYLVKKLGLPQTTTADRMLPKQPNKFLDTGDAGMRLFNRRKLDELPYHLLRAQRIEEFYSNVVFNLDYLYCKLCASSRYLLLRDLSLADELGVPCGKGVQRVYNAVRLAAVSLLHDPSNLVIDLLGRLSSFQSTDAHIAELLVQCRSYGVGTSLCCLQPVFRCFESGSGLVSSGFEIGTGVGILNSERLFVSFTMTSNEISWYDMEGNFVKSVKSDYNFYLAVKFLMRDMPMAKEECTLCVMPTSESEAARRKGLEEVDEGEEEEEDFELKGLDVVVLNLRSGVCRCISSFPTDLVSRLEWDWLESCGDEFILSKRPTENPRRPLNCHADIISVRDPTIVVSMNNVLRPLTFMSTDQRFLVWGRAEEQGYSIGLLSLSGDTNGIEIRMQATRPLLTAYMGDAVVILAQNSGNALQLHVRSTVDLSLSHIVDIEPPAKAWPKPVRERDVSEAFVNTDGDVALLPINFGTRGLPGVIFRRSNLSVKFTSLNDRLKTWELKQVAHAWGQRMRAMFSSDSRFVFTTAAQCIVLVWDVVSGHLIRAVRFGMAEAMLSGVTDDKLVVCHYPDERPDTVCILIMVKVFNLDVLTADGDAALEEDFHTEETPPSFDRLLKSCSVLQNEPNVFVTMRYGRPYVYDLSCNRQIVDREVNLYTYSVTLSPTVTRNSIGVFKLRRETGEGYQETLYYDCDANVLARRGRHGKRRRTFAHVDPHRQLCVCVEDIDDKILVQILSKDGKDLLPNRQIVLSVAPRFLYQFMSRSGFRETCLFLAADKLDSERLAIEGQELRWDGYVKILDFSQILDDPERQADNVQRLRISDSPIFDCGRRLALYNDGIHAINYRLHVHNILNGECVQRIQTDMDGLYTAIVLSPDERIVFGQYVAPARRVEVLTKMRKKVENVYQFAQPRVIQGYRISDGKRLLNYCLEKEPFDMLIANNGQSFILLTHNEQIRIFDIRMEAVADAVSAIRDPQHEKSRDGGYLLSLNLYDVLVSAMKEIMDKRPADPIAHLSEVLRRSKRSS